MRRDRTRVLTVQTDPDPASGLTSAQVVARVQPQIDQLKLPAGYLQLTSPFKPVARREFKLVDLWLNPRYHLCGG